MINDNCKIEVREFLIDYPSLVIRVATTMKDGYVTCIKPIKNICGPELMCSPATDKYLTGFIRQNLPV